MNKQMSESEHMEIQECLRAELSKCGKRAELLETELENIREDCYRAAELLENPVFSNDTGRAVELLRAIAEERN